MRYLTVDGMMSGTGIRDTVEGGYCDLQELGLSKKLIERISIWLVEYEEAHFDQYEDTAVVEKLDLEGLSICRRVKEELVDVKVEYFSNAKMKRVIL